MNAGFETTGDRAKLADTTQTALTVYYDGACPLCRREIGYYRGQRGADRIDWVDVSAEASGPVAPDLCRSDALARFHVRLPDGQLADGAAGFAAMWRALPGWRLLGRIASAPGMGALLELTYRGFLKVRPAMQRVARKLDSEAQRHWPRWLERELRSDHAGEAGAIAIYRGILAVTRDPELRRFAERHLETETRHLETMESLLPSPPRSRLLPIWRGAGFLTGALPALFGSRAVYVTIDAVESFVDAHYGAQIEALDGDPRWRALRATLIACHADEIEHRDEARQLAGRRQGPIARGWTWLVGAGSSASVAIARRI